MSEFFTTVNVLQIAIALITTILTVLVKKLLKDLGGIGKKVSELAKEQIKNNERVIDRLARLETAVEYINQKTP